MENIIDDITKEIQFNWVQNTCNVCNEMFHSLKESNICYVCRYTQLKKEQQDFETFQKEHEDVS